MKHTGRGRSLHALAAAVAILAIIGVQAQQLPTGAGADQRAGTTQAKGGKPGGGGGGGTAIVPITLGAPADIGCSSTEAYAINEAVPALVVGMAGGCPDPPNIPFFWSDAGIAATGTSAGHWAKGVSSDGTIVGMGPGGLPVIFDENGGVATVLPLPTGYTTGDATDIAADGTAIVGYAYKTSDKRNHPFLWQNTLGSWAEGEPIPSDGGLARGVTRRDDEILVVGSALYGTWAGAVVWSRKNSEWTHVELDAGASATDINAAGTIIAGNRRLPLESDPTIQYDVHVVWVKQAADVWGVLTLKGADPNFSEGRAFGIADQLNGNTIVVGYSYRDTVGRGGTPWAVAWTRVKGAAAFGSPQLLPPLSRKWGATANGVNSRGAVVGTSFAGNGSYAVMWKLP